MPKFPHIFFGVAVSFLSLHSCYGQFTYVSPMPGSKMHNKETGIILRTGKFVDAASVRPDLFSVAGSISGEHVVKVKLAADNKTILVRPEVIFSAGETVSVSISDGMRNSDGSTVHGMTFQFEISKKKPSSQTATEENDEGMRLLCSGLPAFIISSTPGAYYDEPIFYWNFNAPPATTDCYNATIISSEGDSIYSHYDIKTGFNFSINENGYITFFNVLDTCFDMVDSNYNLVKKFYMGNGYAPNKHEFRLYPNGIHLMQCYDEQEVDMTAYGGQPDANVTGLVIQELDSNDDVIFEWTSWDHFQFTDAANDILLTTNLVDYVHANALDFDFDGNLLLSSRNLDEITKIDLSTGDIIWRLGGENNEFTFINDTDTPKAFSHQHHFRRLANGHYTLFDNGNGQIPQRSSAKEFVLDQVNKTATLVWNYSHPLVNGYNVFGQSLGSVQILPNGNRLIDWGQISPNVAYADIPDFTEIDSDENIVWEFRFVDSTYVSYRAFKFPWDRCNLIVDTSLVADSITAISADLHWNNNSKFSGFTLEYKQCDSASWISLPLDTNFYLLDGLLPNTCYDWRVQSICEMYDDSFVTVQHQFTTLNPVSIIETGLESTYLRLHPNPATDAIELSYASSVNCEAEVTIYDLSGAIVNHTVLSAQQGSNKSKINLKLLTAGVYTISLKLTDSVQHIRFVIQ